MSTPGALGAKLEASLLRELKDLAGHINFQHFGDRLRLAVMTLHESAEPLGRWMPTTRTISLSLPMLLEQPWSVVREVVKHEMAHQFVHEIMGILDETAHGPAFLSLCRDLGIDAAAAGLPRPASDHADTSGVLRRIAKLLALADSPNQHEAELAMKQAQRLMLKYNIDAAQAAQDRDFSYRHVGEPRARRDGHEQILAGILAQHFFVEAIWVSWYLPHSGRRGQRLELCGSEANLEVASYVWDFLLTTAERLWRSHKRAQAIAGNRERRRYLLGVMLGFREKLEGAASEHRQQGLVWSGDPRLSAYYESRHPRRSSGRAITWQATQAFHSGRAAGRALVLRKPVAGDTGARGRLLTGQ